ncbi:hypothetical protein [Aquipuribacter sp. MA13-6]|uniref:hypothetical protein n=1 Tax=unclassified Aquipuribacter TaxID=2635084 RepID=UPI003EEBE088
MLDHTLGPLVAGRLPVLAILERLATGRPVFHSEADFQHAFARACWQTDTSIDVRLEVRQPDGREYLDMLAIGPEGRTAVEFKYWTRRWAGTAGDPPERFELKSHAATDLARRNFVFDIERLERFVAGPKANGLAVLLTNDPSLWSSPRVAKDTRDQAFRIHDGRALAGTLLWGGGDYAANTRELAGHYDLLWRDYSRPGDGSCLFRYLIVETRAG